MEVKNEMWGEKGDVEVKEEMWDVEVKEEMWR